MFGDDFDRRREKANRDMDSHFKQARRFAFVGAITAVAIYVTVLIFIGWVVVRVMQHFGVI